MNHKTALFNYCLRLGDQALIHSYRLSEWCSNAPILEEDLALTNFALDNLGCAQALLKYAGEVEGNNQTEDDLAYKRGERRFLNALITELPNGDFAFSTLRNFLLSAYEMELYTALLKSNDTTLAAIAAKTIKEVKYHYAHASDWVLRLGDGTPESHERMQNALNKIWPFVDDMFTMHPDFHTLVDLGIAVDSESLKPIWQQKVNDLLAEATLTIPTTGHKQYGSTQGIHTEYLGPILCQMQYLQRAYPDAQW